MIRRYGPPFSERPLATRRDRAISRAQDRQADQLEPSADGPVFTLALAGGLIYAGGPNKTYGLRQPRGSDHLVHVRRPR